MENMRLKAEELFNLKINELQIDDSIPADVNELSMSFKFIILNWKCRMTS